MTQILLSKSMFSKSPVPPKAASNKPASKAAKNGSGKASCEVEWEHVPGFVPDFDFEFKGPKPSYEAYTSKYKLPESYFKHFLKDSMISLITNARNTYFSNFILTALLWN